MSDIQSTFRKMTKSLQKGYEDTKVKFQTTQEILDIKDRISENEEKRMKLVVSLGEKYYLKYRNGEVDDNETQEICAQIGELDSVIFKDLKLIEEKSSEGSSSNHCECGAPLTPEDKFCRSCGKKIEPPKEEIIEKEICPNCGEETPVNSKYCNCCGKKLS